MTSRTINFELNGRHVVADIKMHQTLLEVLQDKFALIGARESCGQGLCGCCSVIVNEKAVSGCLFLAAFADGAQVRTIEGFELNATTRAVQEAFIEAGAFQCGYCTSGFIVMTTQLLDEHPDPSREQIEHYLTGNLCRCAAYPEILDAVKIAAQKRKAL